MNKKNEKNKFAIGQTVVVLHESFRSGMHIAFPATVLGYTKGGRVEVCDSSGQVSRVSEAQVFATKEALEAAKNIRVQVDCKTGAVKDGEYRIKGSPKEEQAEVRRQTVLIDQKLDALPPEFTEIEKTALFGAELTVRMQGGIAGVMTVYGPGPKEENMVPVPRSVRTGNEILQHMWTALSLKVAWGCAFSFTSSPVDGAPLGTKSTVITYYMTPQSLTVMQAALNGRSLGPWTRKFHPRPHATDVPHAISPFAPADDKDDQVGVRPEDLHELPDPRHKVVGDTKLVWLHVPTADVEKWAGFGTAWYVWPRIWLIGEKGGQEMLPVHPVTPIFTHKVDFVSISPWEMHQHHPRDYEEYKGRVPAILTWADWLTLAPLVGTMLEDQTGVFVHDQPTQEAWEELYLKAAAFPQPPPSFGKK